MSGFVCPCCNKKTNIFPTTSGGAEGMCSKYKLDLLGKIPIEPNVGLSSDTGKSIQENAPDSEAAKVYKEIVEKIIKKSEAET